MQTVEPLSTREASERLLKILDTTYSNADIKKLADNATHLNAVEKNSTTKAP